MPGSDPVIGHPAVTDPSTGLANRLHFELVYGYLFHAADRGIALTAMLISIGTDDLEESPELLARVGDAFRRTTRVADVAAYLGDGRFAVLLLGTNLQGARIAVDRIERTVGPVAPPPFAIGLASHRPEMKEASELMDAAERALRAAESRGGGLELT
ncbi:MAG: diguanylate cyclase [Gemmatimonadota bacterium]|jgi:GGDEF domain-containing protein